MSDLVDVGDAIELTFNSVTGADVLMSWLDKDQTLVIDQEEVSEAPAGSGLFPVSLVPTSAGMWTALFTASGAATQVERYYVRAEAAPPVPPLASVGDVMALFGSLSAARQQQAAMLLRRASSLVRSRFPVDAAITAGRLREDVVALGVAQMAVRVLRNPKGVRSETVGPFSRSFFDAGLLVISVAEESMFTPAPVPTWAPPGSIRLSPGLVPAPGWGGRCGR